MTDGEIAEESFKRGSTKTNSRTGVSASKEQEGHHLQVCGDSSPSSRHTGLYSRQPGWSHDVL